MQKELVYRRILLKLSGEALAGPNGFGFDPEQAEDIAHIIIGCLYIYEPYFSICRIK